MKMLSSYPLLLMAIITSSCLWRPSELRKDKDDCIHRCGNIDIPYPFGIRPENASHCILDPNFVVSCNSSSSSPPKPFLKKLNLEILEVRLNKPFYPDLLVDTVTVKIPSVTTCSSRNDRTVTSHNLANSPFRYSVTENFFVSVGCDGYALLLDETGGVIAGCASVCTLQPPAAILRGNRCNGYRCCQAQFAYRSFARGYLMQHSMITAPVYIPGTIKKYNISVSTNNISGNCWSAFLISKEYLQANASLLSAIAAVPVVLDLESRNNTYDTAIVLMIFLLLIIFPVAVSIILTCYFIGQCWWCKTKKRRKETKLKKKYFKGRLEEQRLKHEEAEKTRLFTKNELKKATDNFNKDRVIGKGGQGTVYKGMLSDGKLIAVKRSSSLGESHWKEFINEVIILSHINHRNVVKLLGCCLETKVLHLVYEFIPNGTLSELIHSPSGEFRATWECRLRIASEVAGAIAYLHSSSSAPIYHRDIKSCNILLDHKYIAKVCDFGISRSISVDQTHLSTVVKGTFGYLDPQYFRSEQFTEKSDVYSFGVVLFEILTGRKPVCQISGYAENLAIQFAATEESGLYEMMDPIILESSNMAEDIMVVASLAKRCLHPEGPLRPTMMQVAMELSCLSKKVHAKVAASSEGNTSNLSQEFSLQKPT